MFICFAALAANAQTVIPISSFMGLTFGTPPDEAVQQMSAKNAVYDAKQSKKGNFVFINATVGELKSEHVFFRYSDNKFFEGGAFFRADRPRTIELYHAVQRMIALTYGEGSEKRSATGDLTTAELDAIETGSGYIVTTWTEDPQRNKFNAITVSIEPDLSVLLKVSDIKTAGKNKK
jgi:hypothetical protein